jgi:hypothetical protein
MTRIKPILYLAPALALAAGALLLAQSDRQSDPSVPPQPGKVVPAPVDPEDLPRGRVKIVPAPVDSDDLPSGRVKTVPAPNARSLFDLDSTAASSEHSIQVLSEAQMTASDRDLVANWESAIQEHAGFESLDFDGSGWTYQQLVCPALPNHLFLRFTRNDGTRDMSMFSAAMPRNGDGRVHIIPIVRKGYSLFSPAPIGAMTIAAFNRVRSEEGEGASADWVGTGLCYAALAGANPQTGVTQPDSQEGGETPDAATIPPSLMVGAGGGAVIRFADVSTERPMEWSMTFDTKGKLVKASHAPTSLVRYHKHVEPRGLNKITRTLPQQ